MLQKVAHNFSSSDCLSCLSSPYKSGQTIVSVKLNIEKWYIRWTSNIIWRKLMDIGSGPPSSFIFISPDRQRINTARLSFYIVTTSTEWDIGKLVNIMTQQQRISRYCILFFECHLVNDVCNVFIRNLFNKKRPLEIIQLWKRI